MIMALLQDDAWPRTRRAGRPHGRVDQGVSEETTTGVHRLYQMAEGGELLFPAINVNDSVTKSQVRQPLRLPRVAGRRHQARHRRDDRRQGRAWSAATATSARAAPQSLRGLGARVWVTEIDPICALQAAMEGYRVVTMEDALAEADIFVTTTGNRDIITAEHMAADEGPGDRLQHRPLRQRDRGRQRWTSSTSGKRHQAAGRPDHLPGRPPHHPAGRGPPGEPRLRHRPPELRHVQLLHQPGAGADRAVDQDARTTRSGSTSCRRSSTKRSPGCTSTRSASS